MSYHYYIGVVHIDKKLDRWIPHHGSFASREWIQSQVHYELWEKIGYQEYQVKPRVTVGSEDLTIRIRFTLHQHGGPEYAMSYIHVWGAHTINTKRRRR